MGPRFVTKLLEPSICHCHERTGANKSSDSRQMLTVSDSVQDLGESQLGETDLKSETMLGIVLRTWKGQDR